MYPYHVKGAAFQNYYDITNTIMSLVKPNTQIQGISLDLLLPLPVFHSYWSIFLFHKQSLNIQSSRNEIELVFEDADLKRLII